MNECGLIIWAYNNCRSTMALYGAIWRMADFPVRIVLLNGNGCAISGLRKETGFRDDEFRDIEISSINGSFEQGLKLMNECSGYVHLFCAYQMASVYRRLIKEAQRRNERVFVAGEAPCNMSSGIKWLLKELYIRIFLRWKVRDVVKASEKFICFSGDAERLASFAGWTGNKIVPFGYFPPPIEGSKIVRRTTNHPFVILATGILSRYRGADILVKALVLLKKKGVEYRAIITQDGELLPELKRFAQEHELPIEFPGFVQMDELIKLYETCSVYVGAGRSEPWGMRLNDALNCGAPLIVSRGMGGVKLVDELECGLSYDKNSPEDLANCLVRLATDRELYRQIAEKSFSANKMISPEFMARSLFAIIKSARS